MPKVLIVDDEPLVQIGLKSMLARSFGQEKTGAPETMVRALSDAVHGFVGAAEQSDDLTMLAIRYLGNK